LGQDILLIESFTMSDRVSDTYELEVIASAPLDQIVASRDILGQS
jgi:hypothetical protein